MPEVLIADWSMYQAAYHGQSLVDQYKPEAYTVLFDMQAVRNSGVAGVIIRLGIGLELDPCYTRYVTLLQAAGLPWGAYHAYLPWWSAEEQLQLIRSNLPSRPPLGLWEDLEAGTDTYAAVLPLLTGCDATYGELTGIYSGGPYLNAHFIPAEQLRLSSRKLWIAGYPNFIKPSAGWQQGSAYTLHQYTNVYRLPGLPAGKLCDMSRLNPSLTMEDLMRTTQLTPKGSYLGMHSILPGQTLPLAKRYAAQGTPLAGYMYLNDGQVGVDLQAASPSSWRLLRYYNQALDSMQGLPDWTPAQQQNFCKSYLDHIEQNATDAHVAAAHAILDTNEEDPPESIPGGADSYAKLRDTFILLIQACEQRNAARRAVGQPELHLGLFTFAQGVPEYNEMLALIGRDGQLFRLMEQYGHWAIFHEGVWPGMRIWDGWGQGIPGSPVYPFAGPNCLRFVFLYMELLKRNLPIPRTAVTEFYDAGGYPGDPAEHVIRFGWYDSQLAHLPAQIADRFAFFGGFTANPDAGWSHADYTPFHESAECFQYLRDVAHRSNGGNLMAVVPDDTLRQYVAGLDTSIAQQQALRTALAGYLPTQTFKVGDVVRATTDPFTIYKDTNGTVYGQRSGYTNVDQNVLAVSPDGQWLQVFANPVLWVKAADVHLKGS